MANKFNKKEEVSEHLWDLADLFPDDTELNVMFGRDCATRFIRTFGSEQDKATVSELNESPCKNADSCSCRN